MTVITEQPARTTASTTPPARRTDASRLATRALASLGVVVLLFVVFVTAVSSLVYHRDQDVLFAQLRSELRHGVAPVTAPVAIGHPVALLRIPRLHLRAVVVDGTTSRQLMRGPGHLRGTPLPGQPGTALLLGRRSSFGAPFHALSTLSRGDAIDVTTGQGTFHFVVDMIWRSDDAHTEPGGSTARVELGTGDQPYAPTRSYWVGAHLAGAPAPAGRGDAPQAHAAALDGDRDAAITAYLWAQAAALLAYVVVRWRRSVPGVALWLGAAPLALVVLWNVFDNLAALLPNVL